MKIAIICITVPWFIGTLVMGFLSLRKLARLRKIERIRRVVQCCDEYEGRRA